VTPPDSGTSAGPLDEGRRSRLLAPMQQEGAKGVLIATLSTLLVIGIAVYIVTGSEYWPEVKDSFFNWEVFKETFPSILENFRRNIVWFMIAEPIILVWALILAVLRSLRGPVFFPLRLLSTIYVDLFRGVPTLLVVYLLGFGVPTLGIPGLPIDGAFWGMVGLILSYSAYVAEVYRAGIESVHPSQTAAARALGLSRVRTLRYVVIPQAVRRVIPPLMNDFIALQKDTALVSVVAAARPEAFTTSQVWSAGLFNFTPILGAALCFLIITIPLTRFTDWLLERQRRQRMATAV
jgi:polar amino acid transport system permease protein